MSKQLFSIISKVYEKQYESLVFKGLTNVETIRLLNDAILIPFILPKNALNKFITNRNIKLFDEINKEYLFSNKRTRLIADIDFWHALDFFSYVVSTYSDSKDLIKNILGSVLEKHINRKETGAYYTPADTTKYISWNAIFISILNKTNNDIKEKIKKLYNVEDIVDMLNMQISIEEKILVLKNELSISEINCLCEVINKHKIIDPTCGSGAFIISSYEFLEYLNKNLLNNHLNCETIFSTIYGVDISAEAILLTKIRCILHFYLSENFDKWFFKKFDKQFIVSDALEGQDYVISLGVGFDWKTLGKFNCIIGNPPYVEHKSDITNRFISKKCGNLYAYVIERSCNIVNEKGIIAFIVPLPFIVTTRMKDIRNYLYKKSDKIYYSSYADRPGCLFTGVHQRLTIFFAQIGHKKNKKTYTSKYHYWYNEERRMLFDDISYYLNNDTLLPKIGNELEYSIFTKINNCSTNLSNYFVSISNYSLWVSTRIGFWTKAFMNKINTNELKQYYLPDNSTQKVIYCLLNSSTFYYYWILTSDCWHVTNSDINSFKFDMTLLNDNQINQLCELAVILNNDLERNKVKINTKQTIFEYKHKFSKNIIDRIDDILSIVYNLNDIEKEYVKNYALKYRLNTCHKEV